MEIWQPSFDYIFFRYKVLDKTSKTPDNICCSSATPKNQISRWSSSDFVISPSTCYKMLLLGGKGKAWQAKLPDGASIWSFCKSNYMNPRLPRTGEILISNLFPHGKWILLKTSFHRKLGPHWKWEGWCYLQTPRGLTANCSFKSAGLERPFRRPNWPMGGGLEWGEDFDQSQATIVATSMTRVLRSGRWRDRLWPRLHRLTLTPVITRG